MASRTLPRDKGKGKGALASPKKPVGRPKKAPSPSKLMEIFGK